MAAFLPEGIPANARRVLSKGDGLSVPDHQMWLSLPAFLAVRHGIADRLKIISGNDNGLR